MNNDIKEILDDLKEDVEQNILIEVRGNVFKPLVDYITNLQEENKRLHNQYDLMENSLDEKQEVIDKTIEYIENYKSYEEICEDKYKGNGTYYENVIREKDINHLLDILRGKDNDNKTT